jgi:predicted Zn-dependent peptidase
MSWMGDSLLCFDKIIDPQDAIDTLQSTTLKELHELAKQLFVLENMVVASIGPQRADEAKQLLLESLTF